MTRWRYITLIGALAVIAAAAEDTRESRIPEAFPEGRTAPRRETAPIIAPPVAVPPGAAAPALPVTTATPPPPANADWLLRRMAESEDAQVRRRASEAWPVAESFVDDMNVLARALADPSEAVRAAAVARLERLDAAQVFGYVMRTLVGGALEQARPLNAALPALGAVLEPFMLETLRTELETPLHRRIAAYCLGRMGALTAIDALGEYAWSNDYALSRACADALYSMDAPQTAPLWMALLDHHDAYCRILAGRALAQVGGPNAFERLRQQVLDPNGEPALQSEIIYALREHPPTLLYPLLVDLLEVNRALRPHALRLLREQAGVDFGWDMPAWRNWLQMVTAEPSPPPIVPGQ